MIQGFCNKTKNPHRLASMFLIGVFTDEPDLSEPRLRRGRLRESRGSRRAAVATPNRAYEWQSVLALTASEFGSQRLFAYLIFVLLRCSRINVLPYVKPVREPYQQQRDADKIQQMPEINLVRCTDCIHSDILEWTQVPYFFSTFRDL